ncbi:ACP S-malonyltransferase [Saccharothrix sp. Mg75]|uniref:ACP S-malonyltransferase n=1 Tax=Saccharothrix sp. Mg75 TaxID=3445357 RepID=UPI003EF07CC5
MLFPGMGAYHPGVLTGLRHLPEVLEVVEAVDRADRGRHRVPDLLLDPAAPDAAHLLALDRTALHLAIYTASVAASAVLLRRFRVRPHVLVGHSAGEVAALVAAGGTGVGDGARVILARDAAFAGNPLPPSGMIALTLPADEVPALLAEVHLPSLQLACDNAPTQSVVSGVDAELAVLAAFAGSRGVRATRLPAASMFHNRMLADVERSFRVGISELPAGPPDVPVFSPLLGRPYRGARELREAPTHHITRPVDFRRTLERLRALGVGTFLETGPRSILTAFARATLPDVRAVSALPRKVTAECLADTVAAVSGPPAPHPGSSPPRRAPGR